MYVFDGFTFAAPISMLTMDIDPIYYARIEKLPAGYKLDEIEKEAETELAKVGKVQEAAGAGISPLLGGASLMMIAHGEDLTQEVIVKEVGGAGYRVYVNMPHTEANEALARTCSPRSARSSISKMAAQKEKTPKTGPPSVFGVLL